MSVKQVRFVGVPDSPPTSPAAKSPSTLRVPITLGAITPVIHPVLALARNTSRPLLWDMLLPPTDSKYAQSNLQVAQEPQQITNALLNEAATKPPLPRVTITCKIIPPSWIITVTPTGTTHTSRSKPYVTVGDVLSTLYHSLHLRITGDELDTLYPGERERIAYERRSKSNLRETTIERIDWLGDHRAFLGLSQVFSDRLVAEGLTPGTVWTLHVGQV